MTPTDDIEDSQLTDEDHRRFFELDPGTYLAIFVVIFGIVTGLFYWFSVTMEANAHKKVQQAKAILKRAKDAPDSLTPLTLELETMVHETEKERNWILDELTADSFASRFPEKLKNRFLNETARLQLPANWRQRMPGYLKQWASKKRRQRRRDIKAFLSRLESTLTEIENRIERVETIRENENIQPGKYGGSVRRYLNVKSTVQSRIDSLQASLKTAKPRFDLPTPVYEGAVDLIDPLTKLALHFRGFSALTAAPPAYYHAERLLHDALRIDPKDPSAYYYLGVVYRKLNMGPVASEHKIRALKWDPTYKRKTILETFRNRLKQKPNNLRRRYDLAWALYEVGKMKEAKKHLKRILRRSRGTNSMVRVLARKRLSYILEGEPPYSKLTNF